MAQLSGNAYYAYFASQLDGDGSHTISRWTDGSRGLTPLTGYKEAINPLAEGVFGHGVGVHHNVMSPPNRGVDESALALRSKNNQSGKKIKKSKGSQQTPTKQRGKGSGAIGSSHAPAVEHRRASRLGRLSKRPRQGKASDFPAQPLIRDIFSP